MGIWHGTSDTVLILDLYNLPSVAKADITDVRTVASYSWLDTVAPAIVVPGAPFLFKGPSRRMKLRLDRNWTFVDQQQQRLRDAPLLPLFEAIKTLDSGFDFGSFDIITNRGNLKKLMAWVNGFIDQELRIDIERIDGDVLVFRRWTPITVDKQVGSHGYRNSFEEIAFDAIRGHTNELSHERVISYTFAGLKMLVQFECDGFIDPTTSAQAGGQSKKTADALVQSLAAMAIKDKSPEVDAKSKGATLKVEERGELIAHSKIIELKTRSVTNASDISTELYAQAFWSQTPTFVVAKHDRGFFSKDLIEKYTLEQLKTKSPANRVIEQVAAILHAVVKGARKGEVGDRWCLISDKAELHLVKGGRGAGRLS